MGLDPVAAGAFSPLPWSWPKRRSFHPGKCGLELKFNDPESLLKCMEFISTRKGGSGKLGEGGKVLAESYGAPQLFMGVKGAPLSPFDPRAIQGLGLHFATSNQGPNHTYGYTFIDELLNVHRSMDPWEIADKPEWVKEWQDVCAVMDSLGLCNWILMGLRINNVVPWSTAVLGSQYRPTTSWRRERGYGTSSACSISARGSRPKTISSRSVSSRNRSRRDPRRARSAGSPKCFRPTMNSAAGRKRVPTRETLQRLKLEEIHHAQD